MVGATRTPTNLPEKSKAIWARAIAEKDPARKLALLKEFYSGFPKHKSTERLEMSIKRQIASLEERVEKARSRKTGSFQPQWTVKVVVTPPYYFRLHGEDECYSYFRDVSGMSDIPLLVYNIPEWTGTLVPAGAVARLAEEKLIAGMKYTEYNLLNLLKYIDVSRGRISIFTGSDAMAYTNLEFGGDGAIIAPIRAYPSPATFLK